MTMVNEERLERLGVPLNKDSLTIVGVSAKSVQYPRRTKISPITDPIEACSGQYLKYRCISQVQKSRAEAQASLRPQQSMLQFHPACLIPVKELLGDMHQAPLRHGQTRAAEQLRSESLIEQKIGALWIV
jgi:hypothetical protein